MNDKIDSHLLYDTITQLSLDGLEEKSDGSWNFRCPLCGDSKKSVTKKRGYILIDPEARFYCHNCNQSMSYLEFCKEVSFYVYIDLIKKIKQLEIETYDRGYQKKEVTIKKQSISRKITDCYVDLLSISETNNDITNYVENRHIPDIHHNNMFYFKGNPYEYFCDTFKSIKYLDKSKKRIEYEGVLVPLITRDKTNIGFTLRVVDHPHMRFVNLTESKEPFFFGEDEVDFNKPIIIVEGLFDKLSFKSKQVLAMLTTDPKIEYIKNIAKNKIIYVYDNEYNNKFLIKNIKKCISNNMSIFFWDDYEKSKDMNDLFIDIQDEKKVIEYILKNTYSDFEAELELERKLSVCINKKSMAPIC